MTTISPSLTSAFKITFGASKAALWQSSGSAGLDLPLPFLGGLETEWLGTAPCRINGDPPFLVAETEQELVGAALVDASGRLEENVEMAYATLLELTRDWHLYRAWHYVPQINAMRGGLERYRQFNIGRWAAFEQHFGKDLRSFMPAASAVGVEGDQLVLLFKAGKTRPTYFENPSQVPAYHYPADYGPRPPGFARGVRVDHATRSEIYLSGTASIEGHQSIGKGDLNVQFKTTMHNIRIMLGRMGVLQALAPSDWKAAGIQSAYFKCYLRDPDATPSVKEWLTEAVGSTTHFTFVRSDICRSDLDIEIEAAIECSPPGMP